MQFSQFAQVPDFIFFYDEFPQVAKVNVGACDFCAIEPCRAGGFVVSDLSGCLKYIFYGYIVRCARRYRKSGSGMRDVDTYARHEPISVAEQSDFVFFGQGVHKRFVYFK